MEKEIVMLIKDIEKTFEKCPWMKEQTLESLRHEPLSEANELKNAIENNDLENIKEEIGDLIYDALLLSAVAEKQGAITQKEIVEKVREKIHRRKPWVFGNEKIETSEAAVKRWFEIKAEEKNNAKNRI